MKPQVFFSIYLVFSLLYQDEPLNYPMSSHSQSIQTNTVQPFLQESHLLKRNLQALSSLVK
jgi:hypothetical protein